jgi:hypothetical protein
MLREYKRKADNGKSSEKNPCEKMPLRWNENVARDEGKQ